MNIESQIDSTLFLEVPTKNFLMWLFKAVTLAQTGW